MLTVEQIALRLQVSREAVHKWLRAGKLVGIRPWGDRTGWRISEAELQKFLAQPPGSAA